jgi:hypothetical protein
MKQGLPRRNGFLYRCAVGGAKSPLVIEQKLSCWRSFAFVRQGESRIQVGDPNEETFQPTPWDTFLLAYAAMVPIVAGTVGYLLLRGNAVDLVLHCTIVWSGAILCFLAGVRRGLSFRQDGGPPLTQLLAMLWLFLLGFASLLSPWASISLALQILGYATMAIYDPISAREGEAPSYFQRLRPIQMAIPIVCLAIILAAQAT